MPLIFAPAPIERCATEDVCAEVAQLGFAQIVPIIVGQDGILRYIGNPPGTVLNNWKADYQSAAGYQPLLSKLAN